MKIKQVSIAWCVRFFEEGFLKRWGLNSYYDENEPCFFLGLEQLNIINNHKGLKIIYPISEYDCSFLNGLEHSENIIFVKSPFLPENFKYKIVDAEIELKDYSLFQPNVLGNEIYCYIGMESRKNEFDFDKIERIQKQIDYKITYILVDSINEFYNFTDLKQKYYDNCFLSLNLSEGTGMTTVRELGLMGRKTITNSKYNFPSMIKYIDEIDIIKIINEEAKKIGTIQPPIDCHNVKDEWLYLDFWLKNKNEMNIIKMRNSVNTQGLIDLIDTIPNNVVMAEIGCYAGESTKLFMESGKIIVMYCIDIWEDELNIFKNINNNHNFELVEKTFDNNVKDYNVVKLKMTSKMSSQFLPKLDVVYIDANHEYEYVKKDIEVSLYKLKSNGIICGHDYNEESPGVIRAVNEFFGKPDKIFSDSSWAVYLKDFKLVDCSEEYWEFVRLLRLDDRVIDGFIKTIPISTEQQIEYMKKYSDCYRIALIDGKPAGYIGVIEDDIRICTHPDFQRKGVGKFMVNEGLKIWNNAFAKVKIENEVSLKLFESCNFKKKFYILEKE